MKKSVILLAVIFFLLIAGLSYFVFQPCANGNRIVILNATTKNIYVRIYDDDYTRIILDRKIPPFLSQQTYRAYIMGETSYKIEVRDAETHENLFPVENWGYVTADFVQDDFFMIDHYGIHHNRWSPDWIINHLIRLAGDVLSCVDRR